MPLSNFDIEEFAKRLKINDFDGVYSDDNIPPTAKKYIFNLQHSGEGGSHWIGVNKNIVFDSLGYPPDTPLEKDGIIYNDEQVQHSDSVRCGLYALYFIKANVKNASEFKKFLNKFDKKDLTKNENLIAKYFTKNL